MNCVGKKVRKYKLSVTDYLSQTERVSKLVAFSLLIFIHSKLTSGITSSACVAQKREMFITYLVVYANAWERKLQV